MLTFTKVNKIKSNTWIKRSNAINLFASEIAIRCTALSKLTTEVVVALLVDHAAGNMVPRVNINADRLFTSTMNTLTLSMITRASKINKSQQCDPKLMPKYRYECLV